MKPEWLNHMPQEFIDALGRAARELAEIMPEVEKVVNAYVDKGTELAEKHANEGDE